MKSDTAVHDEIGLSDASVALRAGLVGRGIQQSLSPRMHVAEGTRLGLDYEYHLFDFDILGASDSDLPMLVEKLGREGYAGLNVTHPFKERVISCLDGLSADADVIGAVNTVVFGPSGAIGHNTDCWGFAESFRRGLHAPRLDTVVLLGAGGAGLAVAKAVLDLGAGRIAIADTDPGKSIRLSKHIGETYGADRIADTTDLEAAVASASGVVNATPVGMAKYPGTPLPVDWLRPDQWVADIVYFPAETELLKAARVIGSQVLPGAGMAIFQAVMAFRLITGVDPDPVQMAAHFGAR